MFEFSTTVSSFHHVVLQVHDRQREYARMNQRLLMPGANHTDAQWHAV